MKLIAHRPMNRADWAWLMAGGICGLFCAALAILPEIGADQPRYGTKWTFVTSGDGKTTSTKEEQVIEPAYTHLITIETSGDVQKIVQAAHDIDPDSFILRSLDHPKLTGSDCLEIVFEGIFACVMVSYLFRIVVKICQRILGVPPLTDEIARDPSTSSG
jgi:hypothetical protein